MIDEQQNRRSFLKRFGLLGIVLLTVITFFRGIYMYLVPARRRKKYHKYLVAKESELPVGEAKEIIISKKPVFVVRLPDGYKVYSGICTHLGCIIRWEQEKERFFCPCHKGVFSKDGQVVSGPPPRPLDQFEVVTENKLIYVMVEEKTGGPWA